MKSHLIPILSLFLTINIAFAQKAPVKFGKVSKKELEMTVYEKDTSAPAVVLCDYGYWSLNDYRFRKVLRIKILKKEGLYFANDVYNGDDDTQIRGKTFNLENGEIVVEKLRNESIYKERVFEDYWRYRIAMPNVKVGSVVDIEYSHQFPPREWYFQREIPVVWSELIIPESQYVDFRKSYFGYEPMYISSKNHWVAKDVPAFIREPYTNSIENYITKFEIDLLEIHIPGLYKEFSTDWDAVARRLEESTYFGGVINSALYLNGDAKDIQEKDTSKLGQLKLAIETIKKIKWNEDESLMPSNSTLGIVYRDGIGNSADINLIFLNLLQKLDIEAHPVILSTRSNGIMPLFNPSWNRLNYVIVYAKIGDKEYLIDATEENAPLGLLPERCLNGNGRIVLLKDRTTKQIELKPEGTDANTAMYILKLTDDFQLKGTVSTMKNEYAAYNYRNSYKSFNSEEELVEDMMENNSDLTVFDYTVENVKNLEEPIKENYSISIKNQAYSIGDQVYINPFLHLKTENNPFKLEERKYPVSFPYLKSKTFIIKIELPEGYEIAELPQPMIIALPDNAGRIIYQIVQMGNTISVTYKFNLNKNTFLPKEYKDLREFYNQIIKKQSEPVILNKI